MRSCSTTVPSGVRERFLMAAAKPREGTPPNLVPMSCSSSAVKPSMMNSRSIVGQVILLLSQHSHSRVLLKANASVSRAKP